MIGYNFTFYFPFLLLSIIALVVAIIKFVSYRRSDPNRTFAKTILPLVFMVPVSLHTILPIAALYFFEPELNLPPSYVHSVVHIDNGADSLFMTRASWGFLGRSRSLILSPATIEDTLNHHLNAWTFTFPDDKYGPFFIHRHDSLIFYLPDNTEVHGPDVWSVPVAVAIHYFEKDSMSRFRDLYNAGQISQTYWDPLQGIDE